MGLFSVKARSLLGVDVGTSFVRVMELKRHAGRLKIAHFGAVAVPQQNLDTEDMTVSNDIVKALRQALKQSGSKLKQASVAVAASGAITKVVEMPSGLSEHDMESQIEVEAGQYIPYPMDDVSLDFEVLGPVKTNPKAQHVLLAAARRQTVERHQATLRQAGLVTKVVDIDTFSIENAYPLLASQLRAPADALTALVDIGEISTRLLIFKNKRIVYTREQNFGGAELKAIIMREYDLSQAKVAALDLGKPNLDKYAARVLIPFRELVTHQVDRMLQFFYASSHYDHVAQMVLVGRYASAIQSHQVMEQQWQMPVSVANPLMRIDLPDVAIQRRQVQAHASSLMTVLGLAMRRGR